MEITFKEVTSENFMPCVNLQAGAGQPYVATNVFSIAQSKVEPTLMPFGIYADNKLVGFIMYSFRRVQRELYLCRFMIDKQFQGRGFGKAALELLRDIAERDGGITAITLNTSPANAQGIRIYTKFGFRDTGILQGNEEKFVLELTRKD